MPVRDRTYIAFNADSVSGEMDHYNLMKAWKVKREIDFDFENAHDLNTLRNGSSEETIKRKLRERMNSAKLLVVLVGTHTKFHHKFVRWEIEIALDAGIPIIVCNINGKRDIDDDLCPGIIKNKLAIHIPFRADILNYAFKNWPTRHYELIGTDDQPRHYLDRVYAPLDAERERKAKEKTARLLALRNLSRA